jgi:hypothetical protein
VQTERSATSRNDHRSVTGELKMEFAPRVTC